MDFIIWLLGTFELKIQAGTTLCSGIITMEDDEDEEELSDQGY